MGKPLLYSILYSMLTMGSAVAVFSLEMSKAACK